MAARTDPDVWLPVGGQKEASLANEPPVSSRPDALFPSKIQLLPRLNIAMLRPGSVERGRRSGEDQGKGSQDGQEWNGEVNAGSTPLRCAATSGDGMETRRSDSKEWDLEVAIGEANGTDPTQYSP